MRLAGHSASIYSDLQTGQVLRQCRKVVGRSGEHQIRHAGVVAAGAGAEIGNCFGQVFATLSSQSWYCAIALKMIEMAAGTTHRVFGAGSSFRNVLRRPRLAQVGPWLL